MLSVVKYANFTKVNFFSPLQYNIKDSFILDAKQACFCLSIELDILIEYVALRADVPLDFIDSKTLGVIVSACNLDSKQDSNLFKSMFRCAENSKRFEVMVGISL